MGDDCLGNWVTEWHSALFKLYVFQWALQDSNL